MKGIKKIVQFEYQFLDLVIEGTYYKGEEQTRDYVGSASEFEIDKIYLFADSNETDLYNLLESADWIDDIKQKAINNI